MTHPQNFVPFEPSTSRALSYGWQRMKANALLFFLVALVAVVIEIPNQGNSRDFEGGSVEALAALLSFAYLLLFAPVINYGIDLIFLQGVRGDTVIIKRLFDGFNNYVNVILANLLVFGLVIIGIVVFIVPGIYIGCRLAFTSYLVMDEGMDPVEAVEASWRMTRGHAGKLFLLGLLSIVIFIAGFLLLIIGMFPALMWIKSSFAALYLSISHNNTPVSSESAPPSAD